MGVVEGEGTDVGVVEEEDPDEAEEVVNPHKVLLHQSIQVLNTLTFHLVSGGGVLCTSDGGVLHFSALSPAPVPGRTSSSRSPANEVPASSRRHLKINKMTTLLN